jgi:hypothetical protein
MLPWLFAADRVNYSRYASVYWLEMNMLEKTHPGTSKVPSVFNENMRHVSNSFYLTRCSYNHLYTCIWQSNHQEIINVIRSGYVHDIGTPFSLNLDASENLKKNWTVQRQHRYGFSAIACDQAIEQTANRDSKTKGGLVGFTLNRGAVNRWILSQSERSAITRQCQKMAGVVDDER